MRKRLLHAFVQQPFLLFFRFLAEHLRDGTKGSQAHQRKHDAGPHRGAAAQQPAHKVELEQAHKPSVHTAHDEQQQADFVKGLH